MRFIIAESNEVLITHSGFALVKLLLEKTRLSSRFTASPLPVARIRRFQTAMSLLLSRPVMSGQE